MSVRPTQTKSRYPRRTRQPYPTGDRAPAPAESSDHPPVGEGDPVVPGPATEAGSRAVGRKAQRAARRARRTVAIVCGVVMAICLILTILIVDMARNRPPAAEITVPVSTASVLGAADRSHHLSVGSIIPNRGASAPEGGNP
jgi:hypothetical protein